MSKSKSILGKISASGRKRIVVPVVLVGPSGLTGPWGSPFSIVLPPDLAVAADLGLQPLRKRVDDRHPHAVQTAGDLVGVVVELAPGVDLGQDHLQRALAAVGVNVDRDAPSVVDDRDRAVGVQRHVDVPAVAGHRLVDRVVDDLVDQVMQPARRRVADVHARAQPDRLDPLEHPDARPGVVRERRLIGRVGVTSSTIARLLVCLEIEGPGG